jgi:RNase P subunit RPR2
MSFRNQAQVYDLQEYRDIKSILEANIRSFIKHGDSQRRQAVHTLVSAILSNHNRAHLSFRSFDVYRTGEDYVLIRAKKNISGDICPGCGRKLRYPDMTLIQVQEEGYCHDLVAWGCRECGEVFTRVEYTGGGFSDA